MNGNYSAAGENGTVAMNNRIPLQSLTAANMVEGSIGYESNVKSGGVGGARCFCGIGADTQYQLDQIA